MFNDYELIYQRNAIEYLLCTFSSTCFGLTRPSSEAMDVKFLYTYSICKETVTSIAPEDGRISPKHVELKEHK